MRRNGFLKGAAGVVAALVVLAGCGSPDAPPSPPFPDVAPQVSADATPSAESPPSGDVYAGLPAHCKMLDIVGMQGHTDLRVPTSTHNNLGTTAGTRCNIEYSRTREAGADQPRLAALVYDLMPSNQEDCKPTPQVAAHAPGRLKMLTGEGVTGYVASYSTSEDTTQYVGTVCAGQWMIYMEILVPSGYPKLWGDHDTESFLTAAVPRMTSFK